MCGLATADSAVVFTLRFLSGVVCQKVSRVETAVLRETKANYPFIAIIQLLQLSADDMIIIFFTSEFASQSEFTSSCLRAKCIIIETRQGVYTLSIQS